MERKQGFIIEEYNKWIAPYRDAAERLLIRIHTLNDAYQRSSADYPIHNVQSRMKKEESIKEKLVRKGFEPTLENAKEYLSDIAGIRIICYFEEDVYLMVQQLKKQKDMLLLREKDYIANPKNNGYQSYHLVFGFPVYGIDDMEYYPVEVQLRTLTMDLWASMEHRVIYKSKHEETQERYRKAKEAFQHFGIELSGLERSMHKLVVPYSEEEEKQFEKRRQLQENGEEQLYSSEDFDMHLSERGENKIGNIFSKHNNGNAVLYSE